MKKFLLGGFLGFVVLFGGCVVLMSSGSDSDVKVVEDVEIKESTVKEKDSKKEKVEETLPKIGDTISVKDVEFTVNNKSDANSVGSGYFEENASGKYLIVELDITNAGSDSVTVDSGQFKLTTDGKTYDPDTSATNANGEGGLTFFLEKLNPDMTLSGAVVFDIPEELHNEELVLEVSSGLFSSKTGKIVLE